MEKVIILAITTLFGGADEHNWTKVENVMTQNVLLDYTSFVGGEPANLTPKQITDSWAGFLPGFDKTKHNLSDFNVVIHNETAIVTYTGKADHFIGKEIWTVEGTYESELKKVNDTWLVSKLKFNFKQQTGNLDLPAEATKRMKK
jgi:SnoaL-like domain